MSDTTYSSPCAVFFDYDFKAEDDKSIWKIRDIFW